jgi:hypothetical protein
MTFKGKHLAGLMSDYFEAAWRDAIVLKDIDHLRVDVLDAISERLHVEIPGDPLSGL